MDKPPHIVVVVVNWNGKYLLRKCLDSMRRGVKNFCYSVIVVDNASTDGSVEMIRSEFPGVYVVKNKQNVGFSMANNLGVKFALKKLSPDYIFLLNNDTLVPKGWLSDLIDLIEEEKEIGIVGCKLVYPNGRIQYAGGKLTIDGPVRIGQFEKENGQHNKVANVDTVVGASMLISVKVIRTLGLFDTGFSMFQLEDTDLCIRAKKYGFRVIYSPKPEIVHFEGQSASKKGSLWKYYFDRRNGIRLCLLNFPLKWLLLRIGFEARHFSGVFLQWGSGEVKLRKNKGARLFLLMKAHWENLRSLKDIISKRVHRNARLPLVPANYRGGC